MIFHPVPDVVETMWEQHAKYVCGGIAQVKRISDDKVQTLSAVMSTISQAFEHYNRICTQCDNYNVWWLCGGASAYLSGTTNTFNDLDVYVVCKNDQTDGENRYPDLVYEINGFQYPVQFIPVNVPFKPNVNFASYLNYFCLYVLSTFDLPICRVALHFPLKHAVENVLCIDVTSLVYETQPVHYVRMYKYRQRQIEYVKNSCSLQLMILFKEMCDVWIKKKK